jgi:hypothetical protein
MSYTIWIQSDNQDEAQEYDTYDNMTDAMQGVEDMKDDFDVVMCDAATDEARARLDLDGAVLFGWRMRVADADVLDTEAIVEDM